MIIGEGNTYNLEIPLTKDGEAIDISEVSIVEFMFDNIRKYYGTIDGEVGTVTYDGEKFIVPLTQEDTFELGGNKKINYQARVKFTNEEVKNTKEYVGYITPTISKEVL